MAHATLAGREWSDPDAGWSLPAWTYSDPEFFDAEVARVIRPSWQVVCHESDVSAARRLPHARLYRRERGGGARPRRRAQRLHQCLPPSRRAAARRAVGLREEAGLPLSRLDLRPRRAADAASRCARATAHRHGAATASRRSSSRSGAASSFVRLEGGGPSVAEMMAPYEAEIAPYRFEDLRAFGRVTLRPRAVNWKNVGDNYSDGLHIAVAHPGLKRLMGNGYGVEASAHVDKMWGPIVERPSANPSERAYQHFLPRGRRICRPNASGCGPISSSGRTSPSTSIPIRSISCSGCRSRRRRR